MSTIKRNNKYLNKYLLYLTELNIIYNANVRTQSLNLCCDCSYSEF